MLTIRIAQMEAFGDAQRDLFIANTLQTIKEKYPIHFRQMGPDQMRALIVRGIERGDQHEIRNYALVCILIGLTVAFGEKFEHSPRSVWANEILSDPKLPAALKVRIIEERLFSDTKGRPVIVE